MIKRKALYLDANTDLAASLGKLKQMRADEVVMVVPKGSVLFHSTVNLKILKHEAEAHGMRLALVTLDTKGQMLAQRAEVTVYKNLDLDTSDQPPVPPARSETPPPPLTSSAPTEIKIRYKRKLPQSQAPVVPPEPSLAVGEVQSASSPSLRRRRPDMQMSRSGLTTLFVIVALLILGGVVYFVLPRATVSLEVRSDLFAHKFKLILADEQDKSAAGKNVFTGRFIEVTKEVIQTFPATGSRNEGNEASGTITVYNYTASLKGLIEDTRFVSPDGLVFRIQDDVLVGPARGSTPGRAQAKVVADEGGTAGNLAAGTKFTIPGLGSTGIDLVYGQSDTPFTGGTDDEVKIVTEEDIEAARESVSKTGFLDIEAELAEQVGRHEELVLPLIQNDIIDSLPSVAAGAERETFDLKAQIRSWTLLPERDQLSGIIYNTVEAITPSGQAVTPQTLASARVEIDTADFLLHTIDFTVDLDGLIAPDLDQLELVGSLANRSVSNAESLLNSVPDVISHKITLWPFWVSRLPILEGNIKITTSYIRP